MDELLPEIRHVDELCRLLEEHKGGRVSALDLRELHCWTDFFIIATVSSGTHLQGLLRRLKEYAAEQGLLVFQGWRKRDDSGGWSLVDMGTAVIHLMSAQSREFYELEELWAGAKKVYPPEPPEPLSGPPYSSKSS
ncbi:MAG: ribosome silencing factor [Treponema sp.]|jgi:ribosome-associated protein|nr:ribosome silencing factor [Treponema sp.]